jgi:hypothetical protein
MRLSHFCVHCRVSHHLCPLDNHSHHFSLSSTPAWRSTALDRGPSAFAAGLSCLLQVASLSFLLRLAAGLRRDDVLHKPQCWGTLRSWNTLARGRQTTPVRHAQAQAAQQSPPTPQRAIARVSSERGPTARTGMDAAAGQETRRLQCPPAPRSSAPPPRAACHKPPRRRRSPAHPPPASNRLLCHPKPKGGGETLGANNCATHTWTFWLVCAGPPSTSFTTTSSQDTVRDLCFSSSIIPTCNRGGSGMAGGAEQDDEKEPASGGGVCPCARPPTPPRQCIIPRCCVCVCVSQIVYNKSFQTGARTGGGGRELTRDPSPVLNLFRAHHVHPNFGLGDLWSS